MKISRRETFTNSTLQELEKIRSEAKNEFMVKYFPHNEYLGQGWFFSIEEGGKYYGPFSTFDEAVFSMSRYLSNEHTLRYYSEITR